MAAEASLAADLAAQISTEHAHHVAGDASLETSLNSEITARQSADLELYNNFSGEMSIEKAAREDADASIVVYLDAADDSLQEAIDAEATARSNADASINTAMTAEASSRVAGDASVAAAASTALATAETSINSAMTAEASSRVAGDASLATAIDNEKNRIDAILDGSTVDLDQFAEIVEFVNGIDLENDNALLSAVTSIGTSITAEESARIAGDSFLQSELGAVETSINTALAAEESSRVAADGSLELFLNGKINTETTARESADSSLELFLNDKINTQISVEASTREVKDNEIKTSLVEVEDALSTMILEEKTRAMEAEGSLEAALSTEVAYLVANTDLTAIDSFSEVVAELANVTNDFENTYFKKVTASGLVNGTNKNFTLASAVRTGSEAIYYNGLLQEEGVDYTISGTTVSFTYTPKMGGKVTAYGVYA